MIVTRKKLKLFIKNYIFEEKENNTIEKNYTIGLKDNKKNVNITTPGKNEKGENIFIVKLDEKQITNPKDVQAILKIIEQQPDKNYDIASDFPELVSAAKLDHRQAEIEAIIAGKKLNIAIPS